jgi:hypothetical protein
MHAETGNSMLDAAAHQQPAGGVTSATLCVASSSKSSGADLLGRYTSPSAQQQQHGDGQGTDGSCELQSKERGALRNVGLKPISTGSLRQPEKCRVLTACTLAVRQLVIACIQRMPYMAPRSASISLMAMGMHAYGSCGGGASQQLKISAPLREKLLHHVMRTSSQLTPRDLASSVAALAHLGIRPPAPWMQQTLAQVIRERVRMGLSGRVRMGLGTTV